MKPLIIELKINTEMVVMMSSATWFDDGSKSFPLIMESRRISIWERNGNTETIPSNIG